MNLATLAPLGLLALASLTPTTAAQDWIVDLNDSDHGPMVTAVLPNGDLCVVTVNDIAQLAGHHRLQVFDGTGKPKASYQLESSAGWGVSIRDLLVRPDGTLLTCGTNWPYAWVGVIDPQAGSMVWESTTVLPPQEFQYMTAVDEQAGSICAGGFLESESGFDDGYVVRLDEAGNVLWQRLLGPFDRDSWVTDLVVLPDGGALVALAEDRTHLVRLSPTGTIVESNEILALGGGTTTLARLPDGTFVLGRGNGDHWIAKIDASANILWQRSYDNVDGNEIVVSPDGGMTMAARSSRPGLLRIDAAGNPEWLSYMTTSSHFNFHPRIASHPDGSTIAAWSSPFTVDPTIYLGRFSNSGAASVSCQAEVIHYPVSSQVTSYGFTPSTVPIQPLNEGTIVGITTNFMPVPLISLPYCGDPSTAPPSFCETSPNSVGPGARIQGNGSTSLFSNNLNLTTTGLPSQKPCIYFYGSSPMYLTFGNGTLCVGGQKRRLSPQFSDAHGTLLHDFDAIGTPITVGSNWYFQCWYRDPASGGSGFNLSDGLTTTWCP